VYFVKSDVRSGPAEDHGAVLPGERSCAWRFTGAWQRQLDSITPWIHISSISQRDHQKTGYAKEAGAAGGERIERA